MTTLRSPWPLFVISMLALVGIANGITYYLATSTDLGLLESSPYEQGLGFEATVQARTNAEKLGGAMALNVSPKGVTIQLTGPAAELLRGEATLHALFPADSRRDFTCSMVKPTALELFCPHPVRQGTWLFSLSIEHDNKLYRFEKRMIIGRS